MWQFLLFLIVVLIIGGIIFYGWAKLVLAAILIIAVAVVVIFFALGISGKLDKPTEPKKPAEPKNPSADEFRAMKAAEAATSQTLVNPVFLCVRQGDKIPPSITLTSGRFMTPNDMTEKVALLADAYAVKRYGESAVGTTVNLRGHLFTIIGTFRTQDQGYDSAVLLPSTFANALGYVTPAETSAPGVGLGAAATPVPESDARAEFSREYADEYAKENGEPEDVGRPATDDELARLRRAAGLEK